MNHPDFEAQVGSTTIDSVAFRPHSLEERAIEARIAGEFATAATLFANAAAQEAVLATSLHLALRGAHCLIAADRRDEADAIAAYVVSRARSEGIPHELADALGLVADEHTRNGRLTDAAQALSEAMYAIEQMPDDPMLYQVTHNLGVSYADCGYYQPALELLECSLRLAQTIGDRQFSYSSIAAACHAAALDDPDPDSRTRLLHEGLYAATAALDPNGESEPLATSVALAHRSMMLAGIGHYGAALADANACLVSVGACNLRDEVALAYAAQAIARWRGDGDSQVLDLIQKAYSLAIDTKSDIYLVALHDVHVEVLWSLGRFGEARDVLRAAVQHSAARLHHEAQSRYQFVRLGVEHHRVAALSESDPLTGLSNRRFLAHWLPEALSDSGPVCVGVIDLDGFKQVNDRCTYAHGDLVLQDIARMLERVCRRGDSVVRLGGDEFVMVLRDTSPGDARNAFERIRTMIATRQWEWMPADLHLSASVGVAVGSGAIDAQRVLAAATEALQIAKRSGRDRIAFR